MVDIRDSTTILASDSISVHNTLLGFATIALQFIQEGKSRQLPCRQIARQNLGEGRQRYQRRVFEIAAHTETRQDTILVQFALATDTSCRPLVYAKRRASTRAARQMLATKLC